MGTLQPADPGPGSQGALHRNNYRRIVPVGSCAPIRRAAILARSGKLKFSPARSTLVRVKNAPHNFVSLCNLRGIVVSREGLKMLDWFEF